MRIKPRKQCYTWSRTQERLYRRESRTLVRLGCVLGAVGAACGLALVCISSEVTPCLWGMATAGFCAAFGFCCAGYLNE